MPTNWWNNINISTISSQTKNNSNDLAFKAKIIEDPKQNGNYATAK